METSLFQSILIALTVGVASGAIGTFVILKRMALVGDALSHVALPGIALALAYGIDPFWGVIVSLAAAAFLVWWLEMKSELPTDALVGILFTASLAVGILTIPDTEILESLFGGFSPTPLALLSSILGGATLALALSFILARQFLFVIASPEVAEVSGIKKYHNLLLLIIFGVVVALGIKLVGTLLMGALTIIPASVAKNLAKSMKSYMILATILGGVIAVGGVLVSHYFGFLPGPTIIIVGIILFIFSLVARRKI